jgi:hypothetical protein
VEEFYQYDPASNALEAWLRRGGRLRRRRRVDAFVSPRLGVRFDLSGPQLRIWRPDGRPFQTEAERDAERKAARARADAEHARAEELAALLRRHGIEPPA